MSDAALPRIDRGRMALFVLSTLVIAAAAFLLIGGGPGTRLESPRATAGSPGGEAQGQVQESGPPTAGSSPSASGLPGGVPSPRPEGSPDPDANKAHGDLKFEVKLIPDCTSQGLPMRAEILTTPGAAITLAVVYKDGQTYGQFGTFRANANGQLVYPWTVPASVPDGLGRFLAGADDQSLGTSAAGYWNFRIQAPGRC